MRLSHLSADSGWMHALYPVDPATGERARRRAETVRVIDDPAAVDAYFAAQAGGW